MEIVSRSVCTSYYFKPSTRKFTLSIPTVASIVGHLSLKMLSESQMFFSVESNFFQVSKDFVEIIAQSFIVDKTCFDSFTDLNPFGCFNSFFLTFFAEEGEFMMSDIFKFWMTFVLRINEVLNLSHLELSHSYQTISRCNLVPKAKTDLTGTEGNSTTIEL